MTLFGLELEENFPELSPQAWVTPPPSKTVKMRPALKRETKVANKFESVSTEEEEEEKEDAEPCVLPPPAPLFPRQAKPKSKTNQAKPKSRKKSKRFMCNCDGACDVEHETPHSDRLHVSALFQPSGCEVAATSDWQWVRMDSVMDSGSAVSVAPKTVAPWIPMTESEGSRNGVEYTAADGGKIPNLGQQVFGGDNRRRNASGCHVPSCGCDTAAERSLGHLRCWQ